MAILEAAFDIQPIFDAASILTEEIRSLSAKIKIEASCIERFRPTVFNAQQKEVLIILLETLIRFQEEAKNLEKQDKGIFNERFLIDTVQKTNDLKQEIHSLITGVYGFDLGELMLKIKMAQRHEYIYDDEGKIVPTPIASSNIGIVRIFSILKIWRRRWFGVPIIGQIIAPIAKALDYESKSIREFRTKIQKLDQKCAVSKTSSELEELNAKYQKLAFSILEQPEELLIKAREHRKNLIKQCVKLMLIINKLDNAITQKITELEKTNNVVGIEKFKNIQTKLCALKKQLSVITEEFSPIELNPSSFNEEIARIAKKIEEKEIEKDKAFLFKQEQLCGDFNQIAQTIDNLKQDCIFAAQQTTDATVPKIDPPASKQRKKPDTTNMQSQFCGTIFPSEKPSTQVTATSIKRNQLHEEATLMATAQINQFPTIVPFINQ